MYKSFLYSYYKFAIDLNWGGDISGEFKLLCCKVRKVISTYVECSPQWGKPLLGIFGVKVTLDPMYAYCEVFVGDFLKNPNPEITVSGGKGMCLAFVIKLDID